jgi:hypothetical protein
MAYRLLLLLMEGEMGSEGRKQGSKGYVLQEQIGLT